MFKKPLANLLRPNSLNDIVGQKHLIANNSLINKMVKNQKVFSLLFYGKPGIGKTSLAIALANELGLNYEIFNAVVNNKKDLEAIIDKAKKDKKNFIVIIEEIHRLNKDKQDILLSYLEDGTIFVFATTTENPFFVVNPAIRSRMQVLELNSLSESDIEEGINNIIKSNKINLKIDQSSIKMISKNVNGDLRQAFNIIELLLDLYSDEEIDESHVKNIISRAYLLNDRNGDEHYDLLSALHKSLRGSDVDAALHYLARLIEAGDIISIFRRLYCVAYEDVGLANPNMALKVDSAYNAFNFLGLPEGVLPLGLITIELALSPKSNSSYTAINKAIQDVKDGANYIIPKHLKDAHYNSAKKLGNGIDYKYPHDFDNNWTKQQYLPKEIIDKQYYFPQKNELETKLNNFIKKVKGR